MTLTTAVMTHLIPLSQQVLRSCERSPGVYEQPVVPGLSPISLGTEQVSDAFTVFASAHAYQAVFVAVRYALVFMLKDTSTAGLRAPSSCVFALGIRHRRHPATRAWSKDAEKTSHMTGFGRLLAFLGGSRKDMFPPRGGHAYMQW